MARLGAAAAAEKHGSAAETAETPLRLICLSLLLAIGALVCRIATIW
jgi:hypothetical protein